MCAFTSGPQSHTRQTQSHRLAVFGSGLSEELLPWFAGTETAKEAPCLGNKATAPVSLASCESTLRSTFHALSG
jgi:hypothetical protein